MSGRKLLERTTYLQKKWMEKEVIYREEWGIYFIILWEGEQSLQVKIWKWDRWRMWVKIILFYIGVISDEQKKKIQGKKMKKG